MSIDNVLDATPRVQYVALAAQTAFDYPFPIFQDADLVVNVDGATKTLSTHYTVTGEGEDTGGTVTFLVAMTGGEVVTIYRDIAIERTSDFQINGPLSSVTFNDELDRITLILQQLEARIGRALRLPITGEATDAQAEFSPIANWLSKYITVNASGVPEPAALVAGTISQSIIGALLYPLTATESAAVASPTNQEFVSTPEDVRRYGAVDTGGITDSTAEIQNTVDALDGGTIQGGEVLIPGDANSVYNISDTITLPARPSGDNHTRWYSLKGMGRGAPRLKAISGMASKTMLDASNTPGTLNYYREIKDLYLAGSDIAEVGVDMSANQHYKLENLFINEMKLGSGTFAAGIVVDDAICSQFRDLKVHNGEGYGIFAPGGSGNFFNACLVEGCSFLDCSIDGMSFSGGISGNCFIGNTVESCQGYGFRAAGFSSGGNFFGGNYLENNFNGDMLLGESTTIDHFHVVGNYFNGYPGGLATDYTPIKIKFGEHVHIINNNINANTKSPTGYYILDANIPGGSVVNCVVDGNSVKSLASTTPPNELYNLPANWVDNGNRLIDPVFAPLIPNNVFRGKLPFGGWTLGTAGDATILHNSTQNQLETSSVRMVRNAGSCNIQQAYSNGTEFQNRFVVFAIPVFDVPGGSEFTVTVAPNGTSPVNGQISVSTMTTSQTRIVYAIGFAPSDCTAITCTVNMTAGTSDIIVGQPCLYVGAQQWYSGAADQFWRTDAAPTTGTWARGDIVFNTLPSAAGTPGWVCTTAGTPGTWKAMANVAA